MCLTIPRKVVSIKNKKAIIESGKEKNRVDAFIKVKPGDFVILNDNVIIRKLTKKEAEDFFALFPQKHGQK